MNRKLKPYLFLSLGIIVFDQLSKFFIVRSFLPGQSRQVLGDFLRFTFVYNPGGAFGISLGDYWFYALLSLAAVVVVIGYFFTAGNQPKITRFFLALVVGGAIGNLIDRLLYRQVVDFIDMNMFNIVIPPFSFLSWHFGGFALYRWYTFNIADAAITIGLIGLIAYLVFFNKPVRPLIDVSPPEIKQDERTDN